MEINEYKAPTARLTEWEKEPSLQDLKSDLTAGKPAHQAQILKIDQWHDLMTCTGSAKPKVVKGRSSVQPQLIRRQAEWRYAALTEPFLSSSKLFEITPITFEDENAAKQNELVLNWQFRTKINRVKFIDDLIRAVVDEGTAVIRTGWKRVVITVDEEVPVYSYYPMETEEQVAPLQAALELKQANPREYDETVPEDIKASVDYYMETEEPTVAMVTGSSVAKVEKVLENRPTVEIMNPRNVVIDPSCNGDIEKAMFAVVSFETCKADLLKEPKRYKNLDAVLWDSNSPVVTPEHYTDTPNDFAMNDALRKRVVAYEYWGYQDITGDGTLTAIVATWIGDILIRLEENPYPDQKLPFVLVPYLPIKRGLYGETDAELLKDNQSILGAVTRGMIDSLGRSANSQQGMAKGMLDPLNRRRFDSGQDYEFNPNMNPDNGLIQHKYPELPQSALLMVNLQNQEAEALTGVKSFSGGMSGEAYGDVAAGIRGVMDAASKREMAILRRIAKGMQTTGTKFTSMNAAFLSEKEVIRVTNREYVTVMREDLAGNFDLEVDISTAEVDNAKAQDMSFMVQTIGPAADPSIMMMLLAEIADLKRMPGLAEKLRTFQPQPSPEQQKIQELEIAKLEREVAKLESEINLNNARADEVSASKDLKNLDYVEQETGTKHSRDLERQRAQSQGNQDLQVTKALTASRKPEESEPDLSAAIGFNQLSNTLSDASNAPQPSGTM